MMEKPSGSNNFCVFQEKTKNSQKGILLLKLEPS